VAEKHETYLVILRSFPVARSAMRSVRQSQHVPCSARRAAWHLVAVLASLGIAACGGDSGPPTSPSGAGTGASDILALDVSCPRSILIGEKGPCFAVARLRSGQTPVVFEATWSSSRPDVVTVDGLGVVAGQSAGQADISASYGGRNAAVPVSVTAEDALRIRAAAEQGEFRSGTTVTMWLQGYYSVATAESGRLRLQISNQTGPILSTTPLTVARGGDFFLLSGTFAVPQGSTEVCRMAILEVGSVTIAEPQSNDSGFRCISIRQ
jgi:Big-like domain-containing protein